MVYIGVDPHKDTLEVAACDPVGKQLGEGRFPNTSDGCRDALSWLTQFGAAVVVGVEGSGYFGALLTRVLLSAGIQVLEVPAILTHQGRRRTPSKGKTDQVDAITIARAVASGTGLSVPKRADIYQELKLLVDERKSLIRRKTQLINKTHADLVMLHPGYHYKIAALSRRSHLVKAKKLVGKDSCTRSILVKARLVEIERLIRQTTTLESAIKQMVLSSGTKLHELQGISFVLAATILGETGDPSRIRSEGAFAMLNGTAPVPASSGRVAHHRLNRRGNRELNWAIHTVAVVRARRDARTREYLSRKRAEGKSNKDAMRSLKRHISNCVYRQLVTDLEGLKSAA